jgi:cardiolipin synthase
VSDGRPAKKLRPLQDELTDIPNLITLARVGLIPIVLFLAADGGVVTAWIACAVFVVAAATDFVDGYRRAGSAWSPSSASSSIRSPTSSSCCRR